MTTAPDLPMITAAISPAPAYPAEPVPAPRPALTVVPSAPTTTDEEFDAALRRAEPRLKKYAVRRLYDAHEAEEVVQEAMLRAFQHRHELATEDDLMAWLTVVTGRLVIDRLRVRGRSTPVAELPPGGRAARDTADVVVARDEARIALDALEAMPGRQASVLWAREVEGLSYDEIGERYGMSEPSVRSVLHRARKTLRREYAQRGGTLPAIGLVALAPWLTGLRHAGRLRHVARRAAGATAAAATGLAVATIVPFVTPGSAVDAAPPDSPAVRITSVPAGVQDTFRPAPVSQHREAVAKPARQKVAAAPAPVESQKLIQAPGICGERQAANCYTHDAPPLYVGPTLPVHVAGIHRIGISSNKLDCTLVPVTPITQCGEQGESQ